MHLNAYTIFYIDSFIQVKRIDIFQIPPPFTNWDALQHIDSEAPTQLSLHNRTLVYCWKVNSLKSYKFEWRK